MLKDIWTEIVLPDTGDRRIAIWWETIFDTFIFYEALKRQINVDYLVTYESRFDDTYSDKGMVINKQELTAQNNIVLWYGCNVSADAVKWIRENVGDNSVEISEPELCKEIKHADSLYIYGAGSSGARSLNIFHEQGVNVAGFIDSNTDRHGDIYEDKMIFNPLDIGRQSTIVISAQYYNEIYQTLISNRFNENNIYVDYANSWFWSARTLYHLPLIKI